MADYRAESSEFKKVAPPWLVELIDILDKYGQKHYTEYDTFDVQTIVGPEIEMVNIKNPTITALGRTFVVSVRTTSIVRLDGGQH